MEGGALASFDSAVRSFTDIKTGEGIAVVTHWEAEERGPCALQTALAFARGHAAQAKQQTDELLYYMLRCWLTVVSVIPVGEEESEF